MVVSRSLGQVELVQGGIARAEADVVVVPTSTSGTWDPVWEGVLALTGPPQAMSRRRSAGEVEVHPVLADAEPSPFRYVAVAVSVTVGSVTTGSDIKAIGSRLAKLTLDASLNLRTIAAPLLGTGAGGLEPWLALDALASGFSASAEPGATLLVYIPDPETYATLSRQVAIPDDDQTVDSVSDTSSAAHESSESVFIPPPTPTTNLKTAPSKAGPVAARSPGALRWSRLSGDWKAVIRRADGYRIALDAAHTRSADDPGPHLRAAHLLLGIYDEDLGTRAAFAVLGDSDAAVRAASAKELGVPIPNRSSVQPSKARSVPAMSKHAHQALQAGLEVAQRQGRAQSAASALDLLEGLLSVIECGLVGELADRGLVTVGQDGLLVTEEMAGTSSDTIPRQGSVARADMLGNEREVATLSSIVMATGTALPLAIGLFGDWGSGKSFFMAQMEERIRAIERQGAGTTGHWPYCRVIKQVHFNAWHYVDSNLWASLAATIFSDIALPVAGDERLQADLGDATKRVSAAQRRRVAAEAKVRASEQRQRSLSIAAGASVRAAADLASDKALPDELKDLARTHPEAAIVEERAGRAREFVQHVSGVAGLGQRLALLVSIAVGEVRARRAASAVWAAFVVAVVAGLVALSNWQALAKAAAVVAGLAAALAPAVGGAVQLLKRARDARERPLETARAELEEAKNEESAAEAAEGELKEQLRAMHDRGVRLTELVKAAASKYVEQEGQMSKLRRDFEALTALLAKPDPEVQGQTSQPLPPDKLRDAAKALVGGVANDVADAGQSDGIGDVERIVLYIDDLDRCPPAAVVKVLQAVHLLLAFKIFVVIVAVDSRWLEASLKAHYEELLEEPADYLEKIIQIPFVLRPMSDRGYRRLVGTLATNAGWSNGHQDSRQAAEQHDRPQPSDASPSATGTGAASVDGGSDRHAGAEPVLDPGHEPGPSTPAASTEPPPISDVSAAIDALEIGADEQALLASLGVLVRTPRAAKRMVNIYRIIRVAAQGADAYRLRPAPDGRDEFQAVVVLLGVLIGMPKAAHQFFDLVRDAPPDGTIWTLVGEQSTVEPGPTGSAAQPVGRHPSRPDPLAEILDALRLLKNGVTVGRVEVYQRWVPVVERFSYHRSARRSQDQEPPAPQREPATTSA
jgi:hypothetical protein